ncbi:MAG: GNAT family N-acetyltransferase [Armatimonadetes bacterium]|nr:GNAT family N-acetyltransferase [Armatimonadota bacterium]
MDEVIEAARQNVIHTYLDLARTLPEAVLSHTEGFWSCQSKVPIVLANFAIGFDSDNLEATISALEINAAIRPSYRVFVVTGDRPSDLAVHLESGRFQKRSQLSELICENVRVEAPLELVEYSDRSSRMRIAKFMIGNFFWRRDAASRDRIIEATARSTHRLLCFEGTRGPIAAVMLTESDHTLGLYNLCVDPLHRRKGIGTQIFLACATRASMDGKRLVLQTEDVLKPWYLRCGCKEFGEVCSFAYRNEARV